MLSRLTSRVYHREALVTRWFVDGHTADNVSSRILYGEMVTLHEGFPWELQDVAGRMFPQEREKQYNAVHLYLD